MMDISERIDSEKTVYKGIFLKVVRTSVTLPDGNKSERDIVRHPGAVAVLAINQNGEILLERQYRTALDKVILEIPAGKKEDGEDSFETARRELMEETGYRAGRMARLGETVLAAGYSDEVIEIFMAEDLTEGETGMDDDEFLEMEFVSRDKIKKLIMDGTIIDSKTIVSMFYLDNLKR